MTKTDAILTGNHYAFISHPDWWPIFGICPVTRPVQHITPEQQARYSDTQAWQDSLGFGKQTGVIVSASLFEVRIGILGYTSFSTAPIIKYSSLDALLADGWIVD